MGFHATDVIAGQADRPVMDYGIDRGKADAYVKAAESLMSLSEEEVASFVPPLGFVSFCECPACYGGAEGRGVFTWDVEHPDRLTCRYCGEIVYPNPKYRETETLKGKNALGEDIVLPYFLSPETGATHYFSMHAWKYKREWLLKQCDAVAKAYVATGREDYADRAVFVLDRFAQAYPHYPALHNRFCRGIRFCASQQPPFNWDAGRWGYFHNEIPKPVIAVYDMVYASEAFDRLSRERGYDVRRRLEEDFLRETYRIAAASPYHVGNIVGYDVAGVAILGRVLGEPAYVHQALGWMMDNLEEGFFRDGLWHESPSYHYMTVGGLRQAFSVLKGYTDPPGYVYPETGTRLDGFELDSDVAFFARAAHAPEVLDFPNGCSTPVHDTWPGQRRSQPRQTTISTIAPAFGHASLGRGEGPDQLQAQLHFGGTYGHHHLDCLNLTLYAKEREMLPDLGYTWTQLRGWSTSTPAHNTVVVDRGNQRSGRNVVDGSLLRFFPGVSGVSLVEADGRRVYTGLEDPDGYRRLLLVVPVSEGNAYVVDVFRVHGGSVHDWCLHGDADEDMQASCSIELPRKRASLLEPAETWKKPETVRDRYNPYGMIRDLHCGETDGMFRTDLTYETDSRRGIRVHLWAGDAEVMLGRAPSIRRTGIGSNADMRRAYDYWMPQLVVRRRGAAPLQSAFAAVHEPYAGDHFIERVDRLPLTGGGPADIALRIVHAAGVDTVISVRDAGPDSVSAGDVVLRGQCGVVRQRREDGAVVAAHLFEGTELSCGDVRIGSVRPACAGLITGAERKLDGDEEDCLVLADPLPADVDVVGAWMVVTHPGGYTSAHQIQRVRADGGVTRVVLANDHGLRISGDEASEVYFPQRTFTGPTRFRIPLLASLQAGD